MQKITLAIFLSLITVVLSVLLVNHLLKYLNLTDINDSQDSTLVNPNIQK